MTAALGCAVLCGLVGLAVLVHIVANRLQLPRERLLAVLLTCVVGTLFFFS